MDELKQLLLELREYVAEDTCAEASCPGTNCMEAKATLSRVDSMLSRLEIAGYVSPTGLKYTQDRANHYHDYAALWPREDAARTLPVFQVKPV